MNATRERVQEILISGFPHWSQIDVNGMTRFLFWFFEEHVRHDSNYVVAAASELWSYTKERAQAQGKAWNEIRPGFVRYPLTNWGSVAVRFKNLYSDNNLLKIAKSKQQDLQHYVMMQEAFELIPDFNPSSTLEKVAGFINEIELNVRFTKAQAPVWSVMKEVAEELVEETVEVFWDEVRLRCLESRIPMSDDNWRQMKLRIRDRINTQARGSEGMLQMVSAEEMALRKLLNVVEKLDENIHNQLRSDVNEIFAEYELPDEFKDEVFVIVKLVIQKLSDPGNSLNGDYLYSKYEDEVDELVTMLSDFDRSYFDDIMNDTFLTGTSLLVKACLLVLLSILKDLNEEEMKILKDWIHA